MTVSEFIENVPERCRDWQLTIAKHDKGQLRCFSTVPVETFHKGFDWTDGQIILEPSVRLATDPAVVDDSRLQQLKDCHDRLSKVLAIAASISKMIEDIHDKDLKDKIRTKLLEI